MGVQSLLPTHIDLMWPTIEALKQLGGSGTNREIFNKILNNEQLSQTIQGFIHGNHVSKLKYRAGWARSFLKIADIITNSKKGIWSFTKEGESISSEEILYRIKVNRQSYYHNRKSVPLIKDVKEELPKEELPKENCLEWQKKLLETLKLIKPDSFERLCQRVLLASGFSEVKVTGRSNDGGIDGIGTLYINLLSIPILFQCKRYRANVGAREVRDFRGAMMGRCDKGLLITTSSFTPEARKEATRNGAFAVDLIDGKKLCGLLKKLQLGVKSQMIESVLVDSDWFKSL